MGTRAIIACPFHAPSEWPQRFKWREILPILEVARAEHLGWEGSLAGQVRVEFADTFNEFGDAIRVRMLRENKRVVDFVVQYEALIDGVFRPVLRYDGSHGLPHRDLLDWSGATMEKRWAAPETTMNIAVTEAIRDIRAN